MVNNFFWLAVYALANRIWVETFSRLVQINTFCATRFAAYAKPCHKPGFVTTQFNWMANWIFSFRLQREDERFMGFLFWSPWEIMATTACFDLCTLTLWAVIWLQSCGSLFNYYNCFLIRKRKETDAAEIYDNIHD